ncbi:hypothetical protein P4B35_15365 [Pontiellaceae bacterium B12227]|nr:hypothetical protein [Pontiellaceae bacterium B12227]
MKRSVSTILIIFLLVGITKAETVQFSTSTNYISTGEAIEGTYDMALQTNVQEIAGLLITARTDATNHQINADSGSLGINNTSTNADQAARFEAGETLILSFSKDVEITQFDFRYFDAGESFVIASSNQADFVIEYDALTDKGSDFIETNLTVTAGTEITLSVITSGNIGLEAMELSVVGGTGELFLSMEASNDWINIDVDFDGAAATNYVLQSCSNMVSNLWNTVSGTFNADTNWNFSTTNQCRFFRVIEQ